MGIEQFNFSRRHLLTALVCAPGISSEAVSESLYSPDAELIALGSQFEHLASVWDDLDRQSIEAYKNFDITRLIETINPIEAGIVTTRAKTIEGLLVKARAANWAREGHIYPEAEESADKRMAWSIVRDLINHSSAHRNGVNLNSRFFGA